MGVTATVCFNKDTTLLFLKGLKNTCFSFAFEFKLICNLKGQRINFMVFGMAAAPCTDFFKHTAYSLEAFDRWQLRLCIYKQLLGNIKHHLREAFWELREQCTALHKNLLEKATGLGNWLYLNYVTHGRGDWIACTQARFYQDTRWVCYVWKDSLFLFKNLYSFKFHWFWFFGLRSM